MFFFSPNSRIGGRAANSPRGENLIGPADLWAGRPGVTPALADAIGLYTIRGEEDSTAPIHSADRFQDLGETMGRFLKAGGFGKFAGPGWVAEWSNAPVLKTGVRLRVPWVRIPPHPHSCFRISSPDNSLRSIRAFSSDSSVLTLANGILFSRHLFRAHVHRVSCYPIAARKPLCSNEILCKDPRLSFCVNEDLSRPQIQMVQIALVGNVQRFGESANNSCCFSR